MPFWTALESRSSSPWFRRRSPQPFLAFDILGLGGTDLRAKPLVELKRIFRSVVPAGSAQVLYAHYIDWNGLGVFDGSAVTLDSERFGGLQFSNRH